MRKKRKVLTWINSDEQNFEYYEQLRKTWNIAALKNSLKEIDVNDEWIKLEQKLSFKKRQEELEIPGGLIADETDTRRRTIYKIIISTAIAASVLFMIGLAFGVFEAKNKSIEPEVSREVHKRNEISEPFVRHERNASGKLKRLVL